MSDQMPGQLGMFDESTPGAAVSASEVPEGALMPRMPGWVLLAPSDGLWHRAEARRYNGVIAARCGREGRYVADAAHEIMCCSACETPES